MQLVFENLTHQVFHDEARQLVIMRRTRVALAGVDRETYLQQAVDAMRPLRGQRLLFDVRQAPGNNDPAIEESINRFRRQLSAMFPSSAMLVATAIGRLQVARLSRERNETVDDRNSIFLDEDEAIAYLLSRPL